MSVDSAWRRFGELTMNQAWPGAKRLWLGHATLRHLAIIWKSVQALFIAAGIVLGNIALVKILDIVLDVLRG